MLVPPKLSLQHLAWNPTTRFEPSHLVRTVGTREALNACDDSVAEGRPWFIIESCSFQGVKRLWYDSG